LTRTKEANQGPEAELEESKHGQLYQNGDQMMAPMLLISSPPEYWRTKDLRFRGTSRDTVRSEIRMPSLSSSPWMQGAPEKGLAVAIFRIEALISRPASGRPVRLLLEIHAQKRRKPFRCQDTTVSGLTITRTRRQSFQVLDSHTQNHRSVLRSRGRGHCRLKTASCWHRTRFSKAIFLMLPGETRRRSSENMGSSVRRGIRQSQFFSVCFGFGEIRGLVCCVFRLT
jgi:hypothetical protein